MFLSKIKIKNFKSFDDVSFDLNKFNVVVGECSSGKSNLLESLKFLKDLCGILKMVLGYMVII